MEGSIMVDWRRIGRGRRKGWGESWSLHSYRGHEPEGKEIWKRLKQSLGCIAHSRTFPWLAYCFRVDQNGCRRSEFLHAGGVEELYEPGNIVILGYEDLHGVSSSCSICSSSLVHISGG